MTKLQLRIQRLLRVGYKLTRRGRPLAPLHSNDGFRLADCFGLLDLEVHAFIAQAIEGDASRLPPELRPLYVGLLPV